MKALLPLLLSATLCSAAEKVVLGPDDAPARRKLETKVEELSRGRTSAEVLKAIEEWKSREPDSPDPSIGAASYYAALATPPSATFDPDDEALRDKAPVFDVRTAREHLRSGAAELEAALQKFPDRLDVMLRRVALLGSAGEWKPMTAQLEIALQRAARDAQNLRWLDNQPPPRPPSELVRSAVQEQVLTAVEELSESGDERAKKLSALGLKYFPYSSTFHANLGTLHGFRLEWKEALFRYGRALNSARNDSLILSNIARIHLNLWDMEKAHEAANQVLALNNDPKSVALATKLLRELEANKNREGTPNARSE